MLLYPNPSMGKVNVSMKNPVNNLVIELMNQMGELVFREDYYGRINDIEINLSKYPSGPYQIRILSGDNQFVKTLCRY